MIKNMNKIRIQKIFKYAAVDRLRANLKSGHSLDDYFERSMAVQEKDILSSAIEVSGNAPALKVPADDPVSADIDNAIALYEYYRNLDETQASDPRLWTYLSHIEFRKYCLVRWGLGGSPKDLNDEQLKQKAIRYIYEHWFISGNDRDLRRHAIARLWWAAYLTFSPWGKDPEFFSDLKKKDPYYYTKILLLTQDIYQQVLERALGRSNRILISVLDYLGNNRKFAQSREKIRSLMKELNLAYGTKKLIVLDRQSLKTLIEHLANEIDNNKN
jgi:hypothetical protein